MLESKILYCSFCGRSQHEVEKLMAGTAVRICNTCVELCSNIMNKELKKNQFDEKKISTPLEIYKQLCEHVIGQDDTKRILSVAAYNHYKRLRHSNSSMNQNDSNSCMISKSNIMMIGSTGCGKTLLAQTLAKILKVPFAMADATTLTEAGYVGEDVENVIVSLLQAANYKIKDAEMGVICIDEFDKIAAKESGRSITRDVSGQGVQQALLKLIEGTIASVPPAGGRKHPQQEFLKVDTSNILFICSGSFDGLEQIINNRMQKSDLGFGADISNKKKLSSGEIFKNVDSEDLIKYGIIPELIGRLPVITSIDDLSTKDLVRVLIEPKNALIKQYQALFAMEGVDLDITDSALHAIASIALKRKIGARGLRSIMENLLMKLMFEIPDMQEICAIKIDEDVVNGKKEAELIKGARFIYGDDQKHKLAEQIKLEHHQQH